MNVESRGERTDSLSVRESTDIKYIVFFREKCEPVSLAQPNASGELFVADLTVQTTIVF